MMAVTPSRPGAASSSPRRPPQSRGSRLQGRRNSCPCSWIHLFATGRGQRTRLPPSRAPQRHVPSHPVPPSSNIGDFFSPFSRIFRFPTPRVPLQPRVTPQVSPHLSPARTGQPACRVSPSPSPFLRRFHQKRAAFCGAERGHGPGFGTPQQPWGWVSAPQKPCGSSRVKDQRPKAV